MILSLNVFIPLYIGLFTVVPLIILFYIKSQKKFTISLLFNIWQTLYMFFCLFLTLFNTSISTTTISIIAPQNHDFFEFNFADGLNFHNFIINFALTLPIGVICFARHQFLKQKHSTIKNNPALIGLIFAMIIELLQGLLPTGRFVDISDLIFDSLVPCFMFCLTELYFELINSPIKNNIYKPLKSLSQNIF